MIARIVKVTLGDCVYIYTTTNMKRYNIYSYINDKMNYDNFRDLPLMKKARSMYNWKASIKCEDLEILESENKNEIYKRSQYWIKETNATLNKNVKGRLISEYYKDRVDEGNWNYRGYSNDPLRRNEVQRNWYRKQKEENTEYYRKKKQEYQDNKEFYIKRAKERRDLLKSGRKRDAVKI